MDMISFARRLRLPGLASVQGTAVRTARAGFAYLPGKGPGESACPSGELGRSAPNPVGSGEVMLHRARHGWVEVVAGVMFSGKSEELIRRVRRALIAGRRVQLFKSHLDDRYGGHFRISSHDGRQIDAEPVSNSVQVAEKVRPATQVVAIDEAQFLDDGICEVADALADGGMRVIVAGTDMDFRGEPFGPMGLLLARAERIDKLHAICVVCGDPATRNQRLIDGKPAPAEGPTIQVGGAETYEARCRRCHDVPKRTRAQTELLLKRRAEGWEGV